MRFAVESWAPEYGSAMGTEEQLAASQAEVDVAVEVPGARVGAPPAARRHGRRTRAWCSPTACAGSTPRSGSRRRRHQPPRPVRVVCGRRGALQRAGRAGGRRGPPGPVHRRARRPGHPHQARRLRRAGGGRRRARQALALPPAAHGRARGRRGGGGRRGRPAVRRRSAAGGGHPPGTVGYVKTHHVRYLPPAQDAVVGQLAAGERTPVFIATGRMWSRTCGTCACPAATAATRGRASCGARRLPTPSRGRPSPWPTRSRSPCRPSRRGPTRTTGRPRTSIRSPVWSGPCATGWATRPCSTARCGRAAAAGRRAAGSDKEEWTYAQAIWTGSISFGLVNVPVLVTATSAKDVRFNQLARTDGARIRRSGCRAVDGEEVPYEEIVKGYEMSPGHYVIDRARRARRPRPEARHTIDIEEFVDLDEIDPIYFDSPTTSSRQGGREAVRAAGRGDGRESNKVGIGRFVMRTKQYLAALRPMDGTLCCRRWSTPTRSSPDEILELACPTTSSCPTRRSAMAEQLVESLAAEFEPDKYQRRVPRAGARPHRAQGGGQEIVARAGHRAGRAKVVDLVAALEASLAAAKAKATNGQDQARPRRPTERAAMSAARRPCAAEVDGRRPDAPALQPRQGAVPETGFTKGEVIDYYARDRAGAAAPPRATGRSRCKRYPERRRRRSPSSRSAARSTGRSGCSTAPVASATRSGTIDYCRHRRTCRAGRGPPTWPRSSCTPPLARGDDIEAPDDGGVRPRPGRAGRHHRVRRGRPAAARASSTTSASSASPRRRARRACSSTCR